MSQESSYGFPCVVNPNDFTPDAESSTAEELATHKRACELWGKPGYEPNKGCYHLAGPDGEVVVHVARTSWGLGVSTFTMCDECGSIENETIHCWDCGGDFCCASCWPKHDAEPCR